MRPHRWKCARLPHPWDPPGKNTGVGCHFLLQCMKVKSEREVTQSCLTLSNPMDCSLPGSSSQCLLWLVKLEGNKSHEVHSPDFTVKEVEDHEVETISQISHGNSIVELKLEWLFPYFYSVSLQLHNCIMLSSIHVTRMHWLLTMVQESRESYGKKFMDFLQNLLWSWGWLISVLKVLRLRFYLFIYF